MQDSRRFDELYGIVAETKINSTKADSRCLLDSQPYYYALLTVFVAALWVACIAWLVSGPSFFGVLGATTLFAFACGQTAFLYVHDAGHSQLGSGKIMEVVSDVVSNLLLGLSKWWWRSKHGKHHAKTNQEDEDPDLDIPFLVFFEKQCAGKEGFHRITAAYQHFLLVPVLFFLWWSMHVLSIKYLVEGKSSHSQRELVLICTYFVAYATIWFHLLPPLQALFCMFIHHGLVGVYMGAVFIINHRGMPILADEELDYLESQVITSRNIHGGFFIDLVFGGLNFQIEHHLFPYASRNMLRRIQPIVQAFCTKEGILYTKVSVCTAYRDVFRYLYRESAPLRRAKQLWE